ncbi:hypothetical protein HDU84_002858 [Entophlyctis sp. JEL0112]|nr:hypothetical protein HDU84_002858 [Entophlyctis sp. JEL0112]
MKSIRAIVAAVAAAGCARAADITLFCKCSCPPNVAQVLIITKCSACTRAFCIENDVCPNNTVSLSLALPAPASSSVPLDVPDVALQSVSVAASKKPSALPSSPAAAVNTSAPLASSAITSEVMAMRRAAPLQEPDDGWVVECFRECFVVCSIGIDLFYSLTERGSYKDEIVIYVFIILVTGLLLWALLRPQLEMLAQQYVEGYALL